jgi:hypothetical protein
MFDFKAEMNRVSAAQAFEMRLESDPIGSDVQDLGLKWRHVKALLDPAWRCPYCGFLSFGYTDIEQLQAGECAGRNCCNIVLEAMCVASAPDELPQ